MNLALAEMICRTYYRWTGRHLARGPDCAKALYELDQVVVAHDTREDPVFIYGNRAALELFEMTWDDFTRLPSRFSAEPLARGEREALLQTVRENGFTDNYSGVRISGSGKRFFIEQATVWNLLDFDRTLHGQAAVFPVPQKECPEKDCL